MWKQELIDRIKLQNPKTKLEIKKVGSSLYELRTDTAYKNLVVNTLRDFIRETALNASVTNNNNKIRLAIKDTKDISDDINKPSEQINPLPITFYVGDDIISIAEDKDAFSILKNGNIVESNFPSPAYALGAILQYILDSVINLEAESLIPQSDNIDFVAGVVEFLVTLPNLSTEAKKHLAKFYELTTLKDFSSNIDVEENG